MATSYANTGGSGNRTSIITLTDSANNEINGDGSAWVNGNTTDNSDYFNSLSLSSANFVRFDFGVGASKVIDEAKFYQQNTATQGTWQWQGSNDASGWTNIGSSFALGGVATQTITALSGNTTGYRYYQILGVSGNTNSGPYVHEWEFKIDDAGAGGTTPKAPLSNPFSGPFGGPIG